MSLLLNDKSELRAGWKFAVYLLFFMIIWVATGLAITILIAPRAGDLLEDQLGLIALNQVALLAPAVIAMWLTVRFVDDVRFERSASDFSRAGGATFCSDWRWLPACSQS